MATRFAAEKGVEILLEALPMVMERYPEVIVIFAGQHQDVWKEEDYLRRLLPTIQEYQRKGRWVFAGVLSQKEIAAFYPNIDVLVVPSLNSTETFGLVQIEAMLNGVPTVASNLPGVRQPPKMTGMGEVIPIGDSNELADALLRIFNHPGNYSGNPTAIQKMFDPQSTAASYEQLFEELLSSLK
jgi:glycosyltransferase involved in cell wall biosynthesis